MMIVEFFHCASQFWAQDGVVSTTTTTTTTTTLLHGGVCGARLSSFRHPAQRACADIRDPHCILHRPIAEQGEGCASSFLLGVAKGRAL